LDYASNSLIRRPNLGSHFLRAGAPKKPATLIALLRRRSDYPSCLTSCSQSGPAGDLALALEKRRDVGAVAKHEISMLEQITRELTSIVGLCDGAGADRLIRRNLAEIDRRMTVALSRQTSLACALKDCRRELRRRA